MWKTSIVGLTLICVLFFFSCVSGKKYRNTQGELEKAHAEIQQLQTINQEHASTNNALEQEIRTLTANNKSMTSEFNAYKSSCEAMQEKMDAYQAVLHEEYKTILAVKEKVLLGMADFAEKGVEVYEKDGSIYVNMEDKLLYKSGSAAIAHEGKSALGALASALNDYPNLKVIVVGHTDDVKFKEGSNSDNLSLSTERANGVVRVLRDGNNVDASRLTAAGQGRYNPVGDNSTKEGRAKNRRTEIILVPDMSKVWENAKKNDY